MEARSRKRCRQSTVVVEVETTEPIASSSNEGGGRRGRSKTTQQSKGRNSSTSDFRITCIRVPVTDEDDMEVVCKLCHQKMIRRQFRLHNMKKHRNIATTMDDPTVPDHRFYESRLREFVKFMKTKILKCPMDRCNSSYKSCLGLAYHLNTCGKTREEIEACLLECPTCGKKITRPNMAWHKKIHEKAILADAKEVEEQNRSQPLILASPRLKGRKSAIKARECFMPAGGDDDSDESSSKPDKIKGKRKQKDEDNEADSYEIEFVDKNERNQETTRSKLKPPVVNKGGTGKSEFSSKATEFITSKSNSSHDAYWSKLERVFVDPLERIPQNVLIGPEADISEYLPGVAKSVKFKTIVESHNGGKDIIKGFRQLPWFQGELIDTQNGNLVFNAGGPVLGLSWHPNGKVLAVSTGSEPFEVMDYKIRQSRKSCIQIYAHKFAQGAKECAPINSITPKLFICSDYGYATHLQWCNYWPDCWDSYDFKSTTTFECLNKSARVGQLAASFEDGTLRIFSISISDWEMPPTFSPGPKSMRIPIYKKTAEVCLQMDSVYSNAGQICKFEWHNDNNLIAVAYSGGVVAVFDITSTSPLLVETVNDDSQTTTTIINPFWCFQAHLGPVTGLCFDPMSSRFFVTGSKDRQMKLWDLHLRQELESRKVGLIHDICWIRGWIHLAVAVDAAISNLSSQYNFVRFYQLGTNQQRPNCAEFMDISSLTFHEGITIQGTESGNITATYFDNFWREMDYDRNKKKHNVVNLCKVSADPSSFEMLSKDYCLEGDAKNIKLQFNFKEETPQIILSFMNERVKSILPDAKPQFFEDFVRFLPFLRINKVTWCPAGGCFATGYRNGLLTIIPASFDLLYS